MAREQVDGATYLDRRRELVKQRVDVPAWQHVYAVLRQDQPDIVVMLARRMPRLHQLLTTLFPNFQLPFTTVSDFALEEECNLGGKRIAILDDAVNRGRALKTLTRVLERKGVASWKFYALSYMRHDGGELPANSTFFAVSEGWDEPEYRTRSRSGAQALMLQAVPFEIEFPVFELIQEAGFNPGVFAQKLANLAERAEFNVTRLDDQFSHYGGVSRFAVDLNAARGINDKWRFYVDEAAKKIFFTPMPQASGSAAGGGTFSRRALFHLGMQLAAESQEILKTRLDCKLGALCQADAKMLFGREWCEPLPAATSLATFLNREIDLRSDFAEVASEWPELGQWGGGRDESWNLSSCFIKFFHELGKRTQLAETTGHTCESAVGPSFEELCQIMKRMWKSDSVCPDEELHGRVGFLLDQQIDQGYVVPVLSDTGRRVFRRGEPTPYDRMDAELMEVLGIAGGVCEDWHARRKIGDTEYAAWEDMRRSLNHELR